MSLNIFADGSVTSGHWGKSGDDQPASCWAGWVIYRDTAWVAHHSVAYGQVQDASANFSEYGAVASALMYLIRNKLTTEHVVVHSDSQLVMRQMSGTYQCHNERLAKLRDFTRGLAKKFPSIQYVWIRREQNKYGDYCSKAIQRGIELPNHEVPADVIAKHK